MPSGLVFNIQKYSLHDGPGIRSTVFLKGCPLRCAWCYNPEGIAPEPEILLHAERCAGCGQCQLACPLSPSPPLPLASSPLLPIAPSPPLPLTLSPRECLRCGACACACPTQARQLVGRWMTVDEVMADIWKDHVFYDDSGGGVTFSGGEPLLQAAFLVELLRACRQREIHTAVDTSGCAPRDDLLAAAPWTDLFLYDVKFCDDARHRQHTGVSNASIMENLRALGSVHQNIWVRIPVVPGVHDAAELDAIVRLAASVPGVRQVNLLPYHSTGVHKFSRLGKPSPAAVAPPPADSIGQTAARLREFGLPIVAGG